MGGIDELAGAAQAGTGTGQQGTDRPTWQQLREQMQSAYYESQAQPPIGLSAYRNVQPTGSNQLTSIIVELTGASEGSARDYVDEWAYGYWQDNGDWPNGPQALSDAGFILAASKLPTWANLLPKTFIVIEDGAPVLYDNSLASGPVPVEVPGATSYAGLGAGIPTISRAMLDMVRARYTQMYGGRSSGGGGARGPTYDRAAISESIRSQWQGLLLQEPVDVGQLATDFIREATSFYWHGGSLNLEAWVLGKLRGTARYRTLYGSKPRGMSEDEFLGRTQSLVQQFGFRPETELEETEKIMSGPAVNLASAGQRLSGSREYQTAHLGDLSQRFASTIGGLAFLRGS